MIAKAMTRLSRRPINRKLEDKLVQDFWFSLAKLDPEQRIYLFRKLFTPTEILMFSKRLAVLQALVNGVATYEEIEDRYKVISNTISRISNQIRGSHEKLLGIFIDLEGKKKKSRERPLPRRIVGPRTLAGTKRILGF